MAFDQLWNFLGQQVIHQHHARLGPKRGGELTEPGALFTGLGLQPWAPSLEPIVGDLTPDGSAQTSGLLSGDRILSADGSPVADWTAWVEFIRERPDQSLDILVERAGS